jgi:hypothetical protein
VSVDLRAPNLSSNYSGKYVAHENGIPTYQNCDRIAEK